MGKEGGEVRLAIFKESSGRFFIADDAHSKRGTRCCQVSYQSGGQTICDAWNADRNDAERLRREHAESSCSPRRR